MDIGQLLASEDTKMRALAASASNRIAGFDSILGRGTTFLQYAQRVLEAHWRLVQRWGGWSYVVPDIPIAAGPWSREWLSQELFGRGVLYSNVSKIMGFPESLKQSLADAQFVLPAIKQFRYNIDFHLCMIGDRFIKKPTWIHPRSGIFGGVTTVHEQHSEALLNVLMDKEIPEQATGTTRTRSLVPKAGNRLAMRVLSLTHAEADFHAGLYIPLRVGQKWTSAILPAVQEHAPEVGKNFEQFFSAMQEKIWGATSELADIKISCSPCAFMMLGALGEKNSCYNGSNTYCKLFLSTDVPDSFVALYRLKEKSPGWTRPSARAWGIAMPNCAAIVSNYYLIPHVMLESANKEAFRQALGFTGEKVIKSWDELSKMFVEAAKDNTLYTNGDCALYTGPGSEEAAKKYFTSVLNLGASVGRFSHQGKGRTNKPTVEIVSASGHPYPQAMQQALNSPDLKLVEGEKVSERRARIVLEEVVP